MGAVWLAQTTEEHTKKHAEELPQQPKIQIEILKEKGIYILQSPKAGEQEDLSGREKEKSVSLELRSSSSSLEQITCLICLRQQSQGCRAVLTHLRNGVSSSHPTGACRGGKSTFSYRLQRQGHLGPDAGHDAPQVPSCADSSRMILNAISKKKQKQFQEAHQNS